MNIGSIFLTLLADGSKLGPQVEAEAAKAGERGAKTLGQRLAGNARAGLTVAGAAVGTFVASSVELFGGFQERMNEVFTLLPGITEDAMGKMSDDVLAFSRETGKLPDEVIPALYQSLSAGVPPDNVFEFLRTANKAAVAGAATTTDSVNLLSAVTKGYGDTSQEATQKVADLAFQTVKLGQTTYPELAKSIGQVVPLAAALGVEQEELFGITATLTGVTGNTSEVMTQQKAILTALIKANPQMAAGLKKIGFESGEAAVQSLGLKGTLDALTEATGGSTQQMGEMLGSQEALVATLALTGAQSDVATEKIAAMGDAAGGVDDAFTIMDSGIAATGRKIFATVQTLAIGVGEQLQGIGPALLALNQGGQLFGINPAKLFGGLIGAVTGHVIPAVISPFKKIPGLIQDLALGRSLTGALTGRGGMFEGIANAVNRIPGSGLVKSSLGKVGGFMGSTIGKAMGIAAAAAFVLWLVDEVNKKQAEAASKIGEIGTAVSSQITSGTTEQLEQSLAGLKQGIDAIVAETNRNGVITLATPEQITALEGLVAQYNAVQTELNRRAAEGAAVPAAELRKARADAARAAGELVDEIPTALDKGRAAIRAAAERAFVSTIGGQLVRLGPAGVRAGAEASLGVAAGLRDKREQIKAALDQLREDFKNKLGPTKEVALRIGQLFNRRLAKGLKDTDPIIKAQAEGTRALIEAQLIETVLAGGEAGEKIQRELERKMRSKDPDVRAQAKRTKSLVDAALKEQPPTTPGEKIAQDLAGDIRGGTGIVGSAAYALGRAIAQNLLAGVHGSAPTSDGDRNYGGGARRRQHGGPVTAGVAYIVGERRAELFVPEQTGMIVPYVEGAETSQAAGSGGDTFNLFLPDAQHRDPWVVLDRLPRYAKVAKAAAGETGWRAAS